MSKVIVERPRVGRSYSRLRAAPRDLEHAPARESMRRRWKGHAGLNENLAPLRRYLRKQVGRPWRKVYSEVCANLKATSTVQQHVRDHLEDFVATTAYEEEGEVWVAVRKGAPRRLADSWIEMYVCPRTGLLRRAKARKRYGGVQRARARALDRERADRMRALGPWRQLHLLNGHWYEVTLAPAPGESEVRYGLYHWMDRARSFDPVKGDDVVMRAGLWRDDRGHLYGRWGVYAVAKRQLSRREKKQHGLI